MMSVLQAINLIVHSANSDRHMTLAQIDKPWIARSNYLGRFMCESAQIIFQRQQANIIPIHISGIIACERIRAIERKSLPW